MSWLIPAVGIAIVLVEVSIISRLELRSGVRYDYTQGERLDRLFVFLPGLLAGGVENSDVFYPIMVRNGCVLQVSPVGSRFRKKQIITKTVKWLNVYHSRHSPRNFEVVFVGSSLGGDLAYDIHAKLPRKWTSRNRFSFVIIDCPVGRRDLKQPMRTLSWVLKPFWLGVPFNWIKINGFSLTYWSDQIRYFGGHATLKRWSLESNHVIYVKSVYDQFVSDISIGSWRRAAGYGLGLIWADSPHAGYHEVPAEWRSIFEDDIMPRLG